MSDWTVCFDLAIPEELRDIGSRKTEIPKSMRADPCKLAILADCWQLYSFLQSVLCSTILRRQVQNGRVQRESCERASTTSSIMQRQSTDDVVVPRLQGAYTGMILHPEQPRIFTLREFARAQGFADRWRFEGVPGEVSLLCLCPVIE